MNADVIGTTRHHLPIATDGSIRGGRLAVLLVTGRPMSTSIKNHVSSANSFASFESLEARQFYSVATAHVAHPALARAVRGIEVDGNGIKIADGDVNPSTTDGTDFGTVTADGSSYLTETFTLKNTSGKTLKLTGRNRVYISGANAADFQIIKYPAATLRSGYYTTFTVRYMPSAAGDSNATVTIYNNNAADPRYHFSITGSALDPNQTTDGTGDTIFATDSVGNLYTVDPTDGSTQEIGQMSTVMFDIAFGADGTLYGIDANNTLYTIDPTTAAVTSIGRINVNDTLNSLAVGPDGSLYAAGQSLYRIDLSAGMYYDQGSLGGYVSAGDLAFASDGRLLLTTTSNELVEVDPTTGATTDIGPIGAQQVLGLAVTSDGTIYGMSNTTDQIFSIDPVTGQGSNAVTFDDTYGVYGAAVQPS